MHSNFLLCKFTANEYSEVQEKVDQLLRCSSLLDAIIRSHFTIKKHINFNTLIPFLNKHNIFTSDEMELFNKDILITADKVNKLMEWIPKKDEKGVHDFMKALGEACEHSGHYVILKHLYDICARVNITETPV